MRRKCMQTDVTVQSRYLYMDPSTNDSVTVNNNPAHMGSVRLHRICHHSTTRKVITWHTFPRDPPQSMQRCVNGQEVRELKTT
mmetsp:Transcript_23257/g.44387  ORF Transcript_23257/g.44387 Transcript_23257/m.44387 type:complete len:83 (-) Transcript_23257:47-295(-)